MVPSSFTFHFIFMVRSGTYHEPGTHSPRLGWPTSPRDFPVTAFPSLVFCRCWILNSSPHAFMIESAQQNSGLCLIRKIHKFKALST